MIETNESKTSTMTHNMTQHTTTMPTPRTQSKGLLQDKALDEDKKPSLK